MLQKKKQGREEKVLQGDKIALSWREMREGSSTMMILWGPKVRKLAVRTEG